MNDERTPLQDLLDKHINEAVQDVVSDGWWYDPRPVTDAIIAALSENHMTVCGEQVGWYAGKHLVCGVHDELAYRERGWLPVFVPVDRILFMQREEPG